MKQKKGCKKCLHETGNKNNSKTKFKVGDKVRITKNCCNGIESVGKVGIFSGIDKYGSYLVSYVCGVINHKWSHCNNCIEFVANSTKQDNQTPCGVVGCGKEATVHFCQECYDKKFEEVHGEKI